MYLKFAKKLYVFWTKRDLWQLDFKDRKNNCLVIPILPRISFLLNLNLLVASFCNTDENTTDKNVYRNLLYGTRSLGRSYIFLKRMDAMHLGSYWLASRGGFFLGSNSLFAKFLQLQWRKTKNKTAWFRPYRKKCHEPFCETVPLRNLPILYLLRSAASTSDVCWRLLVQTAMAECFGGVNTKTE